MKRRRESPIKRINAAGKVRWLARYTDATGKRKSAGTFDKKGPCAAGSKRGDCCAQHAIDAAYGRAADPSTMGAYAATWIERHPRGEATNRSSRTRLNAVLDLDVEGRPLRDWPLADLRRKHANILVDRLLRAGRAAEGVKGVLRTLSTLCEDAIDDEAAEINFVRGAKVRANDPRVKKAPRSPQVFTFDQMRAFAAAGRPEIRKVTRKPNAHRRSSEPLFYSADNYEPILLTFALTGLRIGEVLALRRDGFKGNVIEVRGTAYEGEIIEGDTDQKHHVRSVPCPPSLRAALESLPPRIDTDLLFPAPSGRVWFDSNFRRDVWEPAQIASGLKILPHDCRHSYVTNLRAGKIDPADLAAVSGHDVETATRVYTHAAGRSDAAIRKLLG